MRRPYTLVKGMRGWRFLVCQRHAVICWQSVLEVLLAGFPDKNTLVTRGTLRGAVSLKVYLLCEERVNCSACQN